MSRRYGCIDDSTSATRGPSWKSLRFSVRLPNSIFDTSSTLLTMRMSRSVSLEMMPRNSCLLGKFGIVDVIGERLDVRLDRGERRLELVREVREVAHLELVRALELLVLPVEALDAAAHDLVEPALLDRHRDLAGEDRHEPRVLRVERLANEIADHEHAEVVLARKDRNAEERDELAPRDEERLSRSSPSLADVVDDEPGFVGADVGDERVVAQGGARLEVHDALLPELDVLDDLPLLVEENDRDPRSPAAAA